MKAVGLDIGTTTICGTLVCVQSGELLEKVTLPNDTWISGAKPDERLQNPRKIERKCMEILQSFQKTHTDIAAIGVTGQMHGIVYVDACGEAVSPLITWQDGRGDRVLPSGETYVSRLTGKTQYRVATGYGAVTHYFNMVNDCVPHEAKCFCTIADYIAMRLSNRTTPILHSSMAASIGLFSLQKKEFDTNAIQSMGMCAEMFPPVTTEEACIGYWKECVPVSPGLGDNQASFLGAEQGTGVLINIGTGSQISVYATELKSFRTLECRPYLQDSYLYVGSSLCGGYAYELLKKFFESVLNMAGVKETDVPYARMTQCGAEYSGVAPYVDPRFLGSRTEPQRHGAITDITVERFCAGALVKGVLNGIAEELYGFYRECVPIEAGTPARIAGSGNGLRKNLLLQQIVCEKFDKQLLLSPYAEEAAYGSALYAAYAAKIWDFHTKNS